MFLKSLCCITSNAHKLPIFSTAVSHTFGAVILMAGVMTTLCSSMGNSLQIFIDYTLYVFVYMYVVAQVSHGKDQKLKSGCRNGYLVVHGAGKVTAARYDADHTTLLSAD